jgi:cell division septation protein DedD
MYLQVLAVARAEADVLAEVLAKKGFRALVAPGPNEKVFRVLVGPAKDATDAAKLKTELEAAGFKPFIKKY